MKFSERCLHTEGMSRNQVQGQPGYILGWLVDLQSFFSKKQASPRLGWPIFAKQDGGGSKKKGETKTRKFQAAGGLKHPGAAATKPPPPSHEVGGAECRHADSMAWRAQQRSNLGSRGWRGSNREARVGQAGEEGSNRTHQGGEGCPPPLPAS